MKRIMLLTGIFVMSFGVSAAAVDGHEIAAKYNCLGCHATDHKIVGPAYRDVAAKYRGQPDAESKLMAKVKSGTAGNWGNIPMPAQQIKDGDLKIIIRWVLSQK